MRAVADARGALSSVETCAALGVPRASDQRAQRRGLPGSQGSIEGTRPRRIPPRALSNSERSSVLDLLHQPRFADMAIPQVYATLLGEIRFFCSMHTMYRILDEHGEVRERRDQLRRPRCAVPQLVATAPNQVWSWDITRILGPAKWPYFYIYVIQDLFSR
jgi:putative transposase